ncbi:MAG: hypothetical protein KIT84_19230 [Labilithrix sp.]|nr:hypothetical protein [Labilithrix sp.]MCW5813168.1 hypothetical protein [Labilithrix sp.]
MRWVAPIALFFAWGFTMHAVGLLLHEFAGHALVAVVLGCGIDAYALTFFGHGQVHRVICDRWTFERVILCDWAGLAVTSAVGLAAGLYLRRRPGLAPMPKLLLALVAFFFLIGQLGYAVNGGFHDLYDPGRTARWLGARGVHWLAWVPALIAYAVAAVLSARAAIDAFRAHFGSRSRLRTVGQLAGTLGIAGVLYFIAFRIEWAIRTDLWMRGVAVEAERIAAERHVAPPFPIDKVLLVIALGALVWALARPVRQPPPPQPIGRSTLIAVVGSTAITFLLVLVLVLAS